MNKRLFVAVNIPGELKARLYAEAGKLLESVKEKKPVSEENIHLTLEFLGLKTEEEEERIIKALEKIRFKKFEAVVSGIGFFTGFNRTIVFYDIGEGKKKFKELNGMVDKAVGKKEKEEFRTHLTVARVGKVLSKSLREELEGKALAGGEFKVESFELMQSKLSSKGPAYSIVKSFKLS